MLTTDYTSLSALERAAVESIIPEPEAGKKGETVEEYLTRIGAGQAALDSYVEQYNVARQAKMSEAVPALLEAGIDPALVVQLAQRFAAASAETRAEVVKLLAS